MPDMPFDPSNPTPPASHAPPAAARPLYRAIPTAPAATLAAATAQLVRENLLALYFRALAVDDEATVQSVLARAGNDPTLEAMILEQHRFEDEAEE